MCVMVSGIWGEHAHHPEAASTHPRQAKEEKDLKKAKAKAKVNGDRHRQTSVVEKGEREFRHSTNGLDKQQTISINGRD